MSREDRNARRRVHTDPSFDPAPLLALWGGEVDDGSVAAALGVSVVTVNRWRNGRSRILGIAVADELAIRAGSHPGILWPRWIERVEAA